MKQLFLLIGAPASGKSTFIKENNLEALTLSTDNIRKMFLGDSINYIDNELNSVIEVEKQSVQKEVFELLYHLTEKRMDNGITTFIDATNINNKNRKRFLHLAKKYNYRVNVIPFGIRFDENKKSYPTLSLTELMNNNSCRQYVVPKKAIESFYNRSLEISLNNQYTIVYPEDFKNYISYKKQNVDNYEKIQFIGDIHSCGSALEELLSDFNENTYYVFTGDYFDRGIETEKTLKILSELSSKENVVFLEGNHEYHLRQWLKNDEYNNESFKETKRYLNKKDVKKIVNKLQPLKILEFHNNILIATHAGFDSNQMFLEFGYDNNLDNELLLRPTSYFTKGVGGYDNDVDESFEKFFRCTSTYSIHGHRNNKLYRTMEFKHSFNLEQQVERGGKLGSVLFEYKDYRIKCSDKSVKNKVYNKELIYKTSQKSSITNYDLKHDKFIISKEIGNGVTVYNFSKKAFNGNHWNKHTISARGLFMNNADEIVARGYDKFFNIGEKETLEEIAGQFSKNQEIQLSEKENGFLGIVSYSKEFDDLIISSKGNGKDYSNLFKKILENTLKENGYQLSELKEFMKKELNGYSATFEVISKKDKHMVNYEKDTVYLLDVIENTFEQQDLIKNDNLANVLKAQFCFKLVHKQCLRFQTPSEFISFVNQLYKKENIEGFVLTNLETGKKVKIKTDWYSALKSTRNYANKLLDKMNKKTVDEKLEFLDYRLKEISSNEDDSDFIKMLNTNKKKIVQKMIETLKKEKTLNSLTFKNIFGDKRIDITLLGE